jgi:hypothetical protein
MPGQYGVRVEMYKSSQGCQENTNAAMQSVGNGITILTSVGALTIESPIVSDVIMTDAQLAGVLGYIGLLNAGINTAAIETAVATLVGSS